jgi:hypothetical protein
MTSGKSKVGVRVGVGEPGGVGVRVIVGAVEGVGERGIDVTVGVEEEVGERGAEVGVADGNGVPEATAAAFLATEVGEGAAFPPAGRLQAARTGRARMSKSSLSRTGPLMVII